MKAFSDERLKASALPVYFESRVVLLADFGLQLANARLHLDALSVRLVVKRAKGVVRELVFGQDGLGGSDCRDQLLREVALAESADCMAAREGQGGSSQRDSVKRTASSECCIFMSTMGSKRGGPPLS